MARRRRGVRAIKVRQNVYQRTNLVKGPQCQEEIELQTECELTPAVVKSPEKIIASHMKHITFRELNFRVEISVIQ